MDGAANWRPTQGADPAAVAAAGGVDPNAAAPAGGDWRTQLQPEARSRIVNKIMETLKRHLPVSVPEGLSELQKIAVRFEEKIYTAATNQSDYLRKISLKMLSMEIQTKTQENPGRCGKPTALGTPFYTREPWKCSSDSKSKPPGSSTWSSSTRHQSSAVISYPVDVSATDTSAKCFDIHSF